MFYDRNTQHHSNKRRNNLGNRYLIIEINFPEFTTKSIVTERRSLLWILGLATNMTLDASMRSKTGCIVFKQVKGHVVVPNDTRLSIIGRETTKLDSDPLQCAPV